MASSVVILDEAAVEYEQIVRYLALHLKSPQAARTFMGEFDHTVNLIRQNALAFPLSLMPELACHGYRKVPVGRYLMLYKVEGDTIFIAHIFHRSQDYARLV